MARTWQMGLFLVVAIFCMALGACSNPIGTGTAPEIKEVKDFKAEAIVVLAKAIAAHGGKKLSRISTSMVRYHVNGEFPLPKRMANLDADITQTFAIPRGMRIEVSGLADGKPYKLTTIASSDGRWSRENDDKPEISTTPVDVYGLMRPYLALETILDCTPTEWTVIPEQSNDRVVCIRHQGPLGISYYFDRKTHLLAKTTAQSQAHKKAETKRAIETFFEDYRNVDGLQLYYRIVGRRDDKETFQLRIKEVRPLDSIPESTFAPPS